LGPYNNDSKINIDSGLKSLLDPAVKKIAVANPQHAAYGQAAVAAMQNEGVYEKVKDKFVVGENMSQTTSFVVSGAADAGVVARGCTVACFISKNERQGTLRTNSCY
jgi:molybdate transport system substrate-binding protein